MPAGRPSAYDPAYCDQIVEFMSEGYSVTAFAGRIRVARQTIYNWAEAHPEFLDALNVGQAVAALWWEDRLRANAQTGEGNATPAIFALKNRASEDWREKIDLAHSGEIARPITGFDLKVVSSAPAGDTDAATG